MAKSAQKKFQDDLKKSISALADKAVREWLAGRVVRCSGCKQFFSESLIDVATCTVCIFTTGRCEDCGGKNGSERSVFSHISAFSRTSAIEHYGNAHHNAMIETIYGVKKTRRFKVLRGGQK